MLVFVKKGYPFLQRDNPFQSILKLMLQPQSLLYSLHRILQFV